MRSYFVCLLVLLTSWVFVLPANAQDTDLIRVAIKPLEPFVNYHENDTYSGFSIDLWQAIAEELDLQEGEDYVWVPVETVTDVLNQVRNRQTEVGIAGISITREREEFLDFTQPMFNAGLQIMTRVQTQGGLSFEGLTNLLSLEIAVLIGSLIGFGVLLGHVMWFAERKTNPAMPNSYLEGIGEAIWWTVTSIIGVSENHPRTVTGRLIGFTWMVIGIIMIAALTADITVSNTVEQLQGNIQSPDDLPGKRVVTVAGTTAEDYLTENGIIHNTVQSIQDAYPMLETEQADAIVFDAPVLLYYSVTEGRGKVHVVGNIFARQDYGIAVPSGSPLREEIDRALLTVIETGQYTEIYNQWFGGA